MNVTQLFDDLEFQRNLAASINHMIRRDARHKDTPDLLPLRRPLSEFERESNQDET